MYNIVKKFKAKINPRSKYVDENIKLLLIKFWFSAVLSSFNSINDFIPSKNIYIIQINLDFSNRPISNEIFFSILETNEIYNINLRLNGSLQP